MDLYIQFVNLIKDENIYIFHFSLLLYILMFKMQLRETQKANNLSISTNCYILDNSVNILPI